MKDKDMGHSAGASSGSPDASDANPAAARNRMEPALKAKWVAALRSGEFEQCRCALYAKGRYCCIGVYGNVRGIENDILREFSGSLGFKSAARRAPVEVLDTLSEIGSEKVRTTLADMNDNGKSFAEIADWIEANL